MDRNGWVTTKEASEKLGVTENFVRKLCNQGRYDKESGICATKLGKEWKIPESEIKRKLGLNGNHDTSNEKNYIVSLENELKVYKTKLATVENTINSLKGIINM